MAKIHVLGGGGGNVFTVAVHITTPGGNNAAGVSWADCRKNSGEAVTVMTEGTGGGLITPAEKLSIENGTLLEGSFQWEDNPAWTNPQRTTDLDLRATQLTTELLATFQAKNKYFGYTRN